MTASCSRVISPLGSKVVALVPATTPVSFAHQMASVYHWPRGTSLNGARSLASSIPPTVVGSPCMR
nr:MAG TPA: hypothetical protein [Caudoviricetes sp.]